jgi:hypothetical protein
MTSYNHHNDPNHLEQSTHLFMSFNSFFIYALNRAAMHMHNSSIKEELK